MTRTITTGVIIFLISAASSMVLVNQAKIVYFTSIVPPLVVVSARAIPEVVAPGDPLIVSVSMVRFRICDSDLSTFVETRSSSESHRTILFRDRIPGGSGKIGESETLSLFTMPVLEPGDYTFRLISHMRCNGAEDVHTILLPLVPFTVTDPPNQ